MENYTISSDSGQGNNKWHCAWWSTILVLTLDKIKMMAVSMENYNYIPSDIGKVSKISVLTLDKIKMMAISMENYNITSDIGQDQTEWQ